MTNPLDDALMSKEAIFGGLRRGAQRAFKGMDSSDVGAKLTSGLMGGAAPVAGAALISGVGLGAAKLLGAIKKKHDFRDMMDTNPDLGTYQSDNPKFFNKAYTSLRSINPTFAKDPVIAGGLMRRMMESPEGAGGILAQSVKPPDSPRGGFDIKGSVGPLNYAQSL